MEQDLKEMAEYKTDHDLLIELRTMMHYMAGRLDLFDKNFVSRDEFLPVKENFVSKDQFEPIRLLVYGCTALLLSAVLLAIAYLVIKH
jgi:hypothetical protein